MCVRLGPVDNEFDFPWVRMRRKLLHVCHVCMILVTDAAGVMVHVAVAIAIIIRYFSSFLFECFGPSSPFRQLLFIDLGFVR